jgi:nucleoside-diphosphate-sugar epimerase
VRGFESPWVFKYLSSNMYSLEQHLLFPSQYLVLTFVRESIMIVMISFQVRDYIHIVDLADGHIAALRKLDEPSVGMCREIDMFVFYAYIVLVDFL